MKEKINFKCRASQGGVIMTNPRSKSESLSETTKNYLENWLKERYFQRTKEFSSKYTEKGIEMEDQNINFLVQNTDFGFLMKNEQRFEDDFFTGTPDIIMQNAIIDIKSSWDLFTFPLFESEITNKMYIWQLQIYMHLCKKDTSYLAYILSNTPQNLIDKEIFYKTKDLELSPAELGEIHTQIQYNMSFDDLNPKHRIKLFEVRKDDVMINQAIERVKECQLYINQLTEKYL